MKISLDWIKDYVALPGGFDMKRLAYDLTMSTVEVEDTVSLGAKFDGMCVGVVNEILPHPNADRLKLCRTDLGNGEIKEIVCGGTNLKAGMKTAVARPGAMVRWHGEGDLVEIKNAKVRGVESYGMICASSEIGLFDLFPFEEEATIVDLSDFDAPAGTGLAGALGLDDFILEIDNKSLTNRPDLWGHYGIAREIAAIYGLPLSDFKKYLPPETKDFTVEIDDTARCPRYIGVKIEGLSTKAAPFKIQSRIWRVGMRPINAIVDITNYVMLAVGQPTHAFDSDNIAGHITVRRAREAEKLLLLNGKELSLTTGDLVIADDEDSVGLAGIMGGAKDSVLPNTEKVILEIANFEALGIRHTASRQELRTEASMRYEKGIDPERADQALSLAMDMFADFFPGSFVTGFRDNYPNKLVPTRMDVSLDWLAERTGKRLDNDKIKSTLERLGFAVTFPGTDGGVMSVVSPSWRSTGDISIADDIMEEVARIYGYENYEPSPITTSFDRAINQPEIDIDRKVREYLSSRRGMNEIFTYPWVRDEYLDLVAPDRDGLLAISTPPSPDEKYIRPSLLPNMFKAVAENLRFFDAFALFESAQIFRDKDYAAPFDEREKLPYQRRSVAGAFAGDESGVTELFRRAKGALESLPRFTHVEPFGFAQVEKPRWADDVVWLNVVYADDIIGSLALLSKRAALSIGVKSAAVMAFEFDLDALKPLPSRTNKFERIPEFPTTEYDISMLFGEPVKWSEIENLVIGKKTEGGLVRSVSFVDVYRGKQIPAGKKSVTFRLVIGSPTKTLTSDEIESCANAIVKRLTKNLGGELRK
jgi:phenylalanyl-tRNA synthetase beta chain